MKIIIGGTVDGSEDVRFMVELPEGFRKYKPDFLKKYFDGFMLQAIADLRVPEYLPLMKKFNDSFGTLKYELVSMIDSGGDVEKLEQVMEEVDLDFIEPKGKSVDEWTRMKANEWDYEV